MMLHASILLAIAGTAAASSRNMVEDKDLPFSLLDTSLAATHLRIRWNKDGKRKVFEMPLNYDLIPSMSAGIQGEPDTMPTNRVVFTGYQRPRPLSDSSFWTFRDDDTIAYTQYPSTGSIGGFDTRVRCRVEVESYRTSSSKGYGYAKITIDLGCNEQYESLGDANSGGECIEFHDHLKDKTECVTNCAGRGVRFEAKVDFASKKEQDQYNSNMYNNCFASLQPFHKVQLFSKTKGYTGSSPRLQYLCRKHHEEFDWDSEEQRTEVPGCKSGIYMGLHQNWVFDKKKCHSVKETTAKCVELQGNLWKTFSYEPAARATPSKASNGATPSKASIRMSQSQSQRQNQRLGRGQPRSQEEEKTQLSQEEKDRRFAQKLQNQWNH